MKKVLVLAFIVMVLCAFNSARADLVVNGGFETGDWTCWTTVPASSGSSFLVDGVLPHSGSYAAALGSIYTDDTIYQYLTTTPGQSYSFSFWLEKQESRSSTFSDFHAYWNGTEVLTLINVANFGYTEYSYTVQATTASTLIKFAGTEPPGRFNLDDVHVNPVPIPGALLLLGPGLVGLTAVRKRLKK